MGIYLTQVTQHLAVLEIWVRGAFDQGFVGSRIDSDGLFEQPVEQLAPAARGAPVEAEDELVEIGSGNNRIHVASEAQTESPGKPLPSKTVPPVRANSADNLPRPKTLRVVGTCVK